MFVECPHCKRELVEGRDYTGKLATCPFCQKAVPPPMPNVTSVVDDLGMILEPASMATPARFDYPVAELSGIAIPPNVLALVPTQLAREKRVLPLTLEDDVLTVVMGEPPAPEMVDNLRFRLNRPITVALAPKETLTAAIRHFYPAPEDEALAEASEEPEPEAEPAPGPGRRRWVDLESPTAAFEKMVAPDSEAVPRMVQSILREAFQLGASRVLILPFKNRVKVVYRIEDATYPREDLPPELFYAILCTLMTMADLSGFIKVTAAKQERRVHLTFRSTQYGLSVLMDIGQSSSTSQLSQLRAAKLGCPFVELGGLEIPRSVLNLVPEHLARKYRIIPVEFDGEKVTLALGSPRDPEALDRLRFALNRPIVVTLATEGAVVAALERYYGSSDPETAGLVRKYLEESVPDESEAPAASAAAPAIDHPAAKPFLDYLRTLYREPMLQIFEEIRSHDMLCRTDPATGEMAVVFSNTDLLEQMPAEAQQYIDAKIRVFRERLASQLEVFLERDPLARGLAATYAIYVACRRLAEGQTTSVNPACMHDVWINGLYALLTRWFPTLKTNGTLAKFVSQNASELSAKVAALLENPALVVNPAAVRPALARLEIQTISDEPVNCHSPWIVHLLDLLIAEAAHARASHLLLLPREDHIDVAYRVQKAVYGRDSLPLALLLPLISRLRVLAGPDDTLEVSVGNKPRRARVHFQCLATGISARIDFLPDRESIVACENDAMASGCRIVDLSQVEIPARLLAVVPKATVWAKRILPVSLEGSEFMVAMSHSPLPREMAALKVLFRRPFFVVLAPEDALVGAIYRHFHPPTAAPQPSELAVAMLQQVVQEIAPMAVTHSPGGADGSASAGPRTP